MVSSPRQGRRDFFGLELVDGNLIALFNFGSERTQRFVVGTGLDDGLPHRVRISRDGRAIVLIIDNEEQDDRIDSEIDDVSLDLGTKVSCKQFAASDVTARVCHRKDTCFVVVVVRQFAVDSEE